MRRPARGAAVGGATLLMLLAVVCLTVFAVLTLVSARNDWALAEKAANAVTEYYAAECRATQTMAQVESQLREGKVPEGVMAMEQEGVWYVSWEEPISESQALAVAAQWDGGEMDVTMWRVVDTGAWTPDESIEVWDGTGAS